jgi:phage shock protein A
VPGLGGRMSTVIKAKISKLLDRAEDPSETLEYSYQKQMQLLQDVKKGIADVVTAKKRLQLQSQKLEQQVVKLDTQARQAPPARRTWRARRSSASSSRRPSCSRSTSRSPSSRASSSS